MKPLSLLVDTLKNNSGKYYGYNSRSHFLRDLAPSLEAIKQMTISDSWFVQKGLLLHPACPLEFRDEMSKSNVWYKRFVAFFAMKAPKNYFEKANQDTHYYIKRVYEQRATDSLSTPSKHTV